MLLLSLGGSVGAQGIDADEIRRRHAQHQGDFDYLLGDWRFEARSADFGEFRGVWSAVRLATGAGAHVMDEYRVLGSNGETVFVSSTLRVFDPFRNHWELVSVHETSGLRDVGTARKVGDEMHLEQVFGVASGQSATWRIRYYDITPRTFSWRADRSRDGGSTWERGHMELRATRIGPARSLGALTSSDSAR